MFIEMDSKILAKAVKIFKKTINKKALPILEQVKFEVSPGKVLLAATDLDTAVMINVYCKTEGEGSFLVPLKTLENIKPNGLIVFRFENSIEIQKSTGNVILKPDNVEEYPVIPMEPVNYELDPGFINGLECCLPAVSEDQCRYVLNGLCMENGKIIATDGRRLHAYEVTGPDVFSLFDKSGVILPTKTIKLFFFSC